MSKNQNDYLNNLRHTAAHLLAKSVKELYPGAKNAIGPAIEHGFYQDFDMGKYKISDEDLPKIEQRMRENLPSWTHFVFNEITLSEARKLFKDNPYKVEMAEEFAKGGKKLLTNDPGNFLDLCKMGHVENPSKELNHFRLLKVAGAYWRGNEKNKMLTRIYGTAFPTKEALDKYVWQQEEALKRDHKKIGHEQELFIISDEVGPGLPIFLPQGAILRHIIEEYIRREKEKRNYQFVWTPHIARSKLYMKSGHWKKYDAMFNPMKLDDEEYVPKAMNCPHHFQVYLSKPRSYRDLPLRVAENGTVYRYEKSGVLNGLFRVRCLTIDDTHTFVRHDQIGEEYENVLVLIKDIMSDFGFNKYKMRVSLRDEKHKGKYMGNEKLWNKAEDAIKTVAENSGIEWYEGPGEAAFYGPKLDLMFEDALGREWQCATAQLDFVQPENFDMHYTDENGKLVRPAILHIAILGSVERFMGIIIEQFGGKFPVWLAPTQLKIIPIADRHKEFAAKIYKITSQNSIRTELDDRNETMQAKIRDATLQKVPYMGIIGDKEMEKSGIDKPEGMFLSVRSRDGKNLGQIDVAQLINKLKVEIEKKI
ncbi:threonine--tRNA ligase [Patescibacteria group bacterium]|nr:threonine--tRNA ligase [Patescibacteria group bacterium]MCL5797623.1 threonine--tRNA ligase [Patescibacteria group bacterium]